jgi:hypothetical protein
MTALGAAGQSAMFRTERTKFRGDGPAIAEDTKGYVIATKNDLTIRDDIREIDRDEGTTYTAAAEALERYLSEHPEERGRLQVVARHDIEGAAP